MVRHHSSQFQKVKTLGSSLFTGLLSTWSKIRGQITSLDDKSTQASHKSHNFVPLDDVVVSRITSGGQRTELADDVIHLRRDIHQDEYRMEVIGQIKPKP